MPSAKHERLYGSGTPPINRRTGKPLMQSDVADGPMIDFGKQGAKRYQQRLQRTPVTPVDPLAD